MADLGTNRRRVWRETGRRDASGRMILEDMEYDLVEVSGKEVFCPSNDSTRARRNDGTTVVADYVGFHILQQSDQALVTNAGAGWGGLRRTA